jgi:outer membrane protein OmpA-like peptidoglycan-associated protein
MRVVGPDGQQLGTIDDSNSDGIKLARTSTADGQHHHIAANRITRIEGDTVHVSAPPAGHTGAVPPSGAHHDRKSIWPWLIGALAAIILLALLLRGCERDETAPAAAEPAAPGATTSAPATGTGVLVTDVETYLAGSDATPRTFTFEKLNFDSGSASIRADDRAELDRLAAVLVARPAARARIVGYTDARGAEQPNAELGLERARSVAAALTAKGVAADRLETASGGEANPTDTNATAGGQFENRRTELVVLSR